jgi:hypothetical protein
LPAAAKLTVVYLLPLIADETISHAALLLTVQVRSASLVGLTLQLPPLAAKLALLALCGRVGVRLDSSTTISRCLAGQEQGVLALLGVLLVGPRPQ